MELSEEYRKLALVAVEVGMANAYLQILEDGLRDKDQTIQDLRHCVHRISDVVLGR